MGFYGNITNTSNTTFSFDRIYPNRLTMDANANNDGIFIGRYVLVEYERNAAYPVVYTKVIDGHLQFYSSPKCEDITRIRFGTGSDEIDENDIVKSYPEGTDSTTVDGGEWPINIDNVKFYRCTGSEKVGEIYYAIFSEITDKNDVFGQKSDYILNYAIDENHYYPQDEAERRTYKGYDSTVWVKSSVTASDGKLITKYVNIADLNSVVPTFDIAADAPTMTPITPHFDADSTNVYYKLHAQPQWGFRIAQTSADKSDEKTQWTRDFYDPSTDTVSKKYATGTSNEIPNWNSETPVDLNAAIYYNAAAFKKQLINTDERKGDIKKRNENIIDEIKIEATGKSGIEYNDHNGKNGPSKSVQVDTQELTINLPSIGNMMSDAWDIIHGPNRDNSDIDSLQGRLDFFKEKINANEIPVRSEEGSYLIGAKINGNTQYNSTAEKIEIEPIITASNTDDAWIYTKIDTEKASEAGYNQNAISIHHKWTDAGNSPVTSDVNENGNTIELYIPKVDKAGHIVGTKNNTVTLPYGYKTITTNGRGNDTNISNDGEQAKQNDIVANSTQDSLALNSGNKWIRIDTDANNDEVVFSHDVHEITNDKIEEIADNLNNQKNNQIQNTINIPDWEFDNAGHITHKSDRIYTLPYGFKTIKVNNNISSNEPGSEINTNGQSAKNTQDILNINTSNKWIKLDNSKDNTVTLGHSRPFSEKQIIGPTNTTVKQFGDTFNLIDLLVDEAGHVIQYHEDNIAITIPQGDHENINNVDDSGNVIQATNLLSTISLDKPTGKITGRYNTTNSIVLSGYEANKNTNHSNNTNDVADNDTINTAFAKLQNQIIAEENARKNAINTLYGADKNNIADTFDTIKEIADFLEQDAENGKTSGVETILDNINTLKGDVNTSGSVANSIKTEINKLDKSDTAQIGQYVSAVSETDGIISVTRADLPIYTLVKGNTNGTVNFNGAEIAVAGLTNMAYASMDDFVSKEEYNVLLEDYNTLKELVNKLDKQLNPVEGE